jgi:hypothetical protein
MAALYLGVASCAAIDPFHASHDEIETWAAYRKEVVKEDQEDGEGSGGLVVRATDVVTDGASRRFAGG